MMPQWSDKYKLHHDLIDAQHKELFRLANFVYRLHPEKTTKQELAVILKSFYQYIQTHFKDEESYMESINYPLRKEHINCMKRSFEVSMRSFKRKKHLPNYASACVLSLKNGFLNISWKMT